jgi:tetratricopeptide (TPR) repeat protein
MVPAVAFLLFSPFMMSMAICVSPFAVMTALAVAMLLLVWRIYESPSRADVAALGAVAGLSSTLPHLTLWAVAGTVAVLPWLVRRRPPLRIWTIAALTGCAALLPILPNLRNLSGMSEVYVERRGVAAEMEPLIMGQKFFERRQVEALWHAGIRGPADVPLGAALQPFAIPRFAVRLSGDVYYEPLGAALAAVGLVACMVLAPHTPAARALLAALVLALFPGAAASAADRASLTRNIPLPMLLPVFSAAGIAVMRRAFRFERLDGRVAAALAAAIALSGVVIFDLVNPRIVPATWLGLTLRALQRAPAGEVLLLEHGKPRNDWLHVAEIARYLPPAPLPVRAYQNGGSLLAAPDDDRAAAPLIFWSPSLEEQESVQRPLCACWPEATLYTLRDAAGLSRAFGARLDGSWEPALPRRQWSAAPCAGGPAPPPSCEPIRAMAHDNLGQDLVAQGRLDEAIGHFREALRLHPEYATAHNSLGLALAQQGRLAEAIAHYREALRLDAELAPAHNNLAMALEATGDPDEAILHYGEAVRIAPTAPVARLNLGAVLAGRGRLDEAIAQLRELVHQSPGLPEGRVALADALERQGRNGEAIAEYREALRDRPGWPPAIDRLAWLLATTEDRQLRNPSEAVTLAAAAVRDGADAGKLRTLAAAYAAAGRFDAAADAAERALGLARGAGQEELARDIDARLAAYRTGRPR